MKIYNSETGINEEIPVLEHPKSDQEMAKKIYESLKRKEDATTQLAILREKVEFSINNGFEESSDREINLIYERFSESDKANYLIGLYFLRVKKDSFKAFGFFEKSLEHSEMFKYQIFDEIDELFMDSGESQNTGIIEFLYRFKTILVMWIDDKLQLKMSNEEEMKFKKLKEKLEKK